MTIHKIGKLLTAQTPQGVIELANIGVLSANLRSQYPPEFIVEINWLIEQLDASTNLTSQSIAPAPMPAIDISDTQADKAAKVADIWRAYPRVGLQLWVDETGAGYIKKGQPIVFQNTPVQFPIPLVSPYLSAASTVYLLSEKSRIGVSLLGGQNYQPIVGTDYITITGAVRADVKAIEKPAMPISNWLPLNRMLPADTLVKVSGKKNNRRTLTLQNSGLSEIWVGWGQSVTENQGNKLLPGGSYWMEPGRYYSDAELYAYSVGIDGAISGQEGLI